MSWAHTHTHTFSEEREIERQSISFVSRASQEIAAVHYSIHMSPCRHDAMHDARVRKSFRKFLLKTFPLGSCCSLWTAGLGSFHLKFKIANRVVYKKQAQENDTGAKAHPNFEWHWLSMCLARFNLKWKEQHSTQNGTIPLPFPLRVRFVLQSVRWDSTKSLKRLWSRRAAFI